ncbi:ATP-dependent RNA helicase DBP4 [Endocarpon pusillum Z07020]|uniref:ATP-dependent RNA helicase n=1 Tax=Endocarpon pusillum (strain Z07020 / HMAS-L-300199) TaxID=1263415 RepID=U1GI91_ENDPU|nr:ATP-dependent RNA helicase DBP4 [Endocarpon pusillum Z07020]ERF71526.1 ATP-dependent RNA helicase DBP4 [Endocarpon pusillum Z07020]
MAPSRHRGSRSVRTHPKTLKRKRGEDTDNVDELSKRVADLELRPATAPILFAELPLSQATQSGLSKSHFKTLTTIQSRAIPAALKSSDILGAAQTGSGKTLAFLIPVLENLYRRRWTEYDGLGALILSPTRELAIQIFEVLRKVGRNHTFSAGLVIGGKPLREERERLGRMNILVATPGRMLQHMDQTAEFEIGNLQMLVLDEADRIMDMGFQGTVDAIVEHLPKERQTLLFSATQTKKVSDLARLSLREPEFVSAHEGAESATPSTLQQNYVVTPLPEKLDTLWSFIRANLKKKILVFLSSGKQVRFLYEALRHLQPGLPLLHLHGRQRQAARLDITTRFSSSKNACLLATDVAARGLDFPAVDWVVQVDCPEDADTYIHRVGRTARYEHKGRAVMFLDPSEEEGMLKALERKKVAIEKINVRQKKMQNTIKNQLQNMCFKDPELKYLGQKCFVSYVRSIHIQRDKDIFKIKELDLESYAASLGLPGTPNVKFVKGEDAKARKNAPRQLLEFSSGSEGDEEARRKDTAKPTVRTKYDRMFERRNQDVLADHYKKMIDDKENLNGAESGGNHYHDTADADEDDDFLAVKRRFDAGDHALGQEASSSTGSDSSDSENTIPTKKPLRTTNSNPTPPVKKALHLSSNTEPLIIDSNRRAKLLKSKKALLKYKGHGSHLHFDSEGLNPHEAEYYEREDEFRKKGLPEEQREVFLREERERAREADVRDKEVERRKRREKKEKRKGREREDGHLVLGAEEGVAVLAPYEEEEEEGGAEEGPVLAGNGAGTEKRRKKWFEDPSSGEDDDKRERERQGNSKAKRRKKGAEANLRGQEREQEQVPQTVEELEAMAQGLLRS